jgi:3-hydroxyisobutyrate dehydrogenase
MPSTSANVKCVAVLGTGAMGAPIARNLAKAGFTVSAWNRTRAKAEPLASEGIRIADTPAEAVRDADLVITMLTDAAAVSAAIEAAAPALRPGTIWVQMSTVGASAGSALAMLAAKYQLIYVDAPVLGSRQPAEQGQLIILGAAPVHARRDVQPVFEAIGRRALWVSDDASSGAASRLKLACNHYVFALTHATAEALALAGKLDVDPLLVIDAITGSPVDNGYFQLKGRAMLEGNFAPSFSLANAAKDARLILEAARDTNLPADVAEASVRRFDRAIAGGHGDKDMAASYLAS